MCLFEGVKINVFQWYMDDFGFIILRHVNSEQTNQYWIHCYNCIRHFYDNKIVIVDSASNPDFLDSPKQELVNCEIIQSEFPGTGEISCYYYFYKNRFFEKAVVIQDSMFIHHKIDFTDFRDVLFLWNTETEGQHDFYGEQMNFLNSMTKVKNNPELMNDILEFRASMGDWKLCFGPSSMVEHKFISSLQEEFSLFDILRNSDSFGTFEYRQAFERFYGLLCCYKKRELNEKPSLLGHIYDYVKRYQSGWFITYSEYIDNIDKYDNINLPIIKITTNRK